MAEVGVDLLGLGGEVALADELAGALSATWPETWTWPALLMIVTWE